MASRSSKLTDGYKASQAVFWPDLDQFCRKYLVITHKALTPEDALAAPKQSFALQRALFEQLMLFDKVSLKVSGENIPLAVMLKMFGEAKLETLIEQDAFRFVLWTPLIVFGEPAIPGINALAHGNLSSAVHNDPEASISEGFRWMTEKPPARFIKRIMKKTAPLYSMPSKELAGQAVETANDTYNSGKLEPLGLSPSKASLTEMSFSDRQRLCARATSLAEYRFLVENNLTSLSNFEYFSYFYGTVKKTATTRPDDYAELAKIERVPNFEALFARPSDALRDVGKLRQTKTATQFRHWLATVSDEDGGNVASEYVKAIVEAKGLVPNAGAKLVKSIAMTAIGTGAGLLLNDPVLGAAGALGLDMLDRFVLEEIEKGWTPRMFFDDLRELEKLQADKKSDPRVA